jgi:hypothetical protein
MDDGINKKDSSADVALSRPSMTSPMGKCTADVKVYLPPELKDRAILEAGKLGATPSELGRDMFFMWLEGMTYGEYVADSRRAALGVEGLKTGPNSFQKLRVIGEVGDAGHKAAA